MSACIRGICEVKKLNAAAVCTKNIEFFVRKVCAICGIADSNLACARQKRELVSAFAVAELTNRYARFHITGGELFIEPAFQHDSGIDRDDAFCFGGTFIPAAAGFQTEMLRTQVPVTGDENEVRTAAAWAEQLAVSAFRPKRLQFFRDIDLLSVDYRVNAFDTDVLSVTKTDCALDHIDAPFLVLFFQLFDHRGELGVLLIGFTQLRLHRTTFGSLFAAGIRSLMLLLEHRKQGVSTAVIHNIWRITAEEGSGRRVYSASGGCAPLNLLLK